MNICELLENNNINNNTVNSNNTNENRNNNLNSGEQLNTNDEEDDDHRVAAATAATSEQDANLASSNQHGLNHAINTNSLETTDAFYSNSNDHQSQQISENENIQDSCSSVEMRTVESEHSTEEDKIDYNSKFYLIYFEIVINR